MTHARVLSRADLLLGGARFHSLTLESDLQTLTASLLTTAGLAAIAAPVLPLSKQLTPGLRQLDTCLTAVPLAVVPRVKPPVAVLQKTKSRAKPSRLPLTPEVLATVCSWAHGR